MPEEFTALWHEIWTRSLPVEPPSWPQVAGYPGVWLLALVGVVVVAIPPLWRVLRPVVTIVHELGHAIVGMLCGRRFTGFVVNADMSGHAVTVGKPSGLGLILTTWAGYPAPAIFGAFLTVAAGNGWAPSVLAVTMVILLLSLLWSRSLFTVLAVLGTGLAVGGLWWSHETQIGAAVLLIAGVLLLCGAWRSLFAVTGAKSGQDPNKLADLTRVTRWFWLLTYYAVLCAATWWAARQLL